MPKILPFTDKVKTHHPQASWELMSYQVHKDTKIAQAVFRGFRDRAERRLKDANGRHIGAPFHTYFFNLEGAEFDQFMLLQAPPGQGGEGRHVERAFWIMALTRKDVAIPNPNITPENPSPEIKVAFFKDAVDDPE